MFIVPIILDLDLATANFMQVWQNEIDFFDIILSFFQFGS